MPESQGWHAGARQCPKSSSGYLGVRAASSTNKHLMLQADSDDGSSSILMPASDASDESASSIRIIRTIMQPNGPLLAHWFEVHVVAPLWGEQKHRK